MPRTLFALLISGAALLTTATPALAAGPARGYYQCYQTVQTQNVVTGAPDGYGTSFVTSFQLKAHHKYDVSFRVSPDYRTQHITVKGHKVRFIGGPWDDDAASYHLKGTYASHGVTMPNSQADPAKRYSLVLRGRSSDADGAPPATEFTGAVPRSFWYCKKR
jgi:hypothetical protein